jgi:2-keto-4-pentenoate hydratase/2-oxohepta-3-ene-1,7-dioic acid hydratase in catechol pathway
VRDVSALRVRCLLNGQAMQDASTAEMIFDVAAQIEHLTAAFTLEPGDVIFTGTPSGVGNWRKPPVRLKAGDRVRVEIERIGAIENLCEAESGETRIV